MRLASSGGLGTSSDISSSVALAPRSNDIYVGGGFKPSPTVSKQFRYDLAILSFVSVFVLATAMFVAYANTKSMKQVAKFISAGLTSEVAVRRLPKSDTVNGEMASRRWKVMPGNVPVFSSVDTGDNKKSKEL